MSSSAAEPRVVIVGAGLAGLTAAHTLRHHHLSPLLLEASSTPGGKVRPIIPCREGA